MEELIEYNLIYGRLLTVSEPHLIERYNRALAAFGLPATKLDEFQIDMMGYSPQVAEEIGVPLYLEQNISKRLFILLTAQQENLPVIGTRYSNTAALLHVFFEKNARVIRLATIKDVLYGEIDDNVLVIDDITNLLSIEQVEFRVLSSEDVLAKADKLRRRIDRLMEVPSAWRDDSMINEMIELARVTGDIRTNDLVPDQLVFRNSSYYLDHFGGVYVFTDNKKFTIICDSRAPGFRRASPWKVDYIAIDDRRAIYEFLARSGRIQLPQASWLKTSGLLDHREKMVVHGIMHDVEPGLDLASMGEKEMRAWAYRNSTLLERDPVIAFLHDIERGFAEGRPPQIDRMTDDMKFLVIRAKPNHADRWTVNRLISSMVPSDYVSRFIFDKQGFYLTYNAYAQNFKDLVVRELVEGYLSDKKALREHLYGLTS
jgi:hypothetical protein